MRMLLRFACFAAASFAGACILAFAFQRRLLYFPEREVESAALERASRLGLEPWRSADGSLRGWRAGPKARPRARALVFHGNAGSALDRNHYAAALARRGISVTLLEYPGYGPLPGSPSERTIAATAVEAVDALASEGPEPLWLIGESLGSGVAARAAHLRPKAVRGLLLVTPFARLVDVAHHHYPFLPGFLLRDRWAPRDDLDAYEGPVAILVAGRDEVVTAAQGWALFNALRGPKRLWVQPEAGHNDLALEPGAGWWEETAGFLEVATRSGER
jgi:alpha-beta hydrolase superfamily lysophospholipase